MLRQPLAVALGLASLALIGCDKNSETAGTSCPATQEACDGLCTSLAQDRDHCGACGHACDVGQVCSNGVCHVSCPAPLTSCGDVCARMDDDPQHCGGCGRVCEAGMVCVNGGCNTACPADQTACNGSCANVESDPAHCGSCGAACAVGDACVDGQCAGCVSGNMQGVFPQLVQAALGSSQHEMDCGIEKAAGSPDVSYAFTAPSAGVYEVDSEGSEVDVILGVLDGSCRGRTLACADTTEASHEKSLRMVLEQNETVVVVAEAKSAAQGMVRLRMNQLDRVPAAADSCTPLVLGGEVPRTVIGETASAADKLTPTCGAQGNGEMVYQFTAPATGRYVFDTYGSNFDTLIAVLEGGCGGKEVACNDDFETGYGVAASATVKLREGDSVLVLVEGVGEVGKFTLHVSASSIGDIDPCCFSTEHGGCGNDPVEACVCAIDSFCCTEEWDTLCAQLAKSECDLDCKPPASQCDVTPLSGTVPQTVTGTTIGALNLFSPSCSTDGSPERLYSFTAPEAGSYAFDTADSKYDTVVFVLEGSCVGDEIACNDEYGTGPTSRAIVTLAANQTVVIAVDGYGGEADDFNLNVFRADTGTTGDCCAPHEGTGCSVDAIKTCVCDFDPYCCDPDNGWDDLCISVAATQCGVCE